MCKAKSAHSGVAMIELIFAIVIMGIVMMSAPMLVSRASNAGLLTVQQEAIVAGSSEIGMILTRQWDENNTKESLYSPVLMTSEDIDSLNEATDADGNYTGRRAGTPSLSTRSFLTSDGKRLEASSTLGSDGDDDDIDDFNNHTATLTSSDTTTAQVGDYIDTSLQLLTTLKYISSPSNYNATTISFNTPFNTTPVGTSNIKAIKTVITSGSHDADFGTKIKLRAFSCNIGTYELIERSF